MGYIRHHAIVVTGQHAWHEPSLADVFDARQAAVEAGCRLVTEVVGPGVNGTSSFLVAPDGSKEGWEESYIGDDARARFIKWLRGDNRHFSWAEVILGDDDCEALIGRNCWDAA